MNPQKRQDRDVNAIRSKPFSEMTRGEKIKHIGKLIVFLLTFGFAFSGLLSD